MLGKSDDMRSKSDKFFIFFQEFFNEVSKCMPKPEKKPKKIGIGAAAKKGAQQAMMEELKAKQAAQRK